MSNAQLRKCLDICNFCVVLAIVILFIFNQVRGHRHGRAATSDFEVTPMNQKVESAQDWKANGSAGNDTKEEDSYFYARGRSYPYWVNSTTKYRTRAAAMKALAEKYGEDTDWIEKNMGSSNLFQDIHSALLIAKSNKNSRPKSPPKALDRTEYKPTYKSTKPSWAMDGWERKQLDDAWNSMSREEKRKQILRDFY